MKFLLRLLLWLVLLYVGFWSGLAAYFSYAESHRGLLTTHLSGLFGRPVSINEVRTAWDGVTPRVQINGLQVEGDLDGEPALSIGSLSVAVDPVSILKFWPQFSEFAVQKPAVEIVSLENNQLQVAGILLRSSPQGPDRAKRLMSWLLDQQGGALHNGEVIWRRAVGDVRYYRNISFVYERQQQARTVQAALITSKGPLAFTARTQGDLLSDNQWDASLEVLGEKGRRLLTSKDLTLNVDDGQGRLTLKTMDVERIRDFMRLAGLVRQAPWIIESELQGRLHDVVFEFAGSLLELRDWSLTASASDVAFKSVGPAPAMNRLRGQLRAEARGGVFVFNTEDSQFEWRRWFDHAFPIKRASGEFTWQFDNDGDVVIALSQGEFEDDAARISNLNASCRVEKSVRQVSSLGQLFKVDSVADLEFKDGRVVSRQNDGPRPLSLEASAQFDFKDLAKLVNYLPNDERIDKFREWSLNAFQSGKVSNGTVSYRGEMSRNAIQVGKAQLDARADFSNVVLDYGYQRDWPILERGRGTAELRNGLLVLTPDEAWINGDPVADTSVQISDLFLRQRSLAIQGSISTSLVKGVDFLFKGPLIKKENQLAKLPVTVEQGRVDIDLSVTIPLNKVSDAQVTGLAKIRNGKGTLPEGVPVTGITASVNFTERSAESDNIRARFLGGESLATLSTTREAQPPALKLSAKGMANVDELQPWVGEHLLTWFSGASPWHGELLIDGGRVDISGVSNLEGVSISAPAPLAKSASESARMTLSMTVGGDQVQQSLALEYQDTMKLSFLANPASHSEAKRPSLFDNSMISIGLDNIEKPKPGVNFVVQENRINLDDWLTAIIDLASYEPVKPSKNTDFLDAMRSIKVEVEEPFFLGREFGSFEASVISDDGYRWVGTVDGDNVEGTLALNPRADVGNYSFRLARLNLVEEPDSDGPPKPIDYSLRPSEYPSISLQVDRFNLSGKALGQLVFQGHPQQDQWVVDTLTLKHNGISTEARGSWRNTEDQGSVSSFDFSTVIDEAEGALTELDFAGIIKKGKGTLNGNISWIGAPHEFDYARLNGEFDLRLRKGELVKVEPGSGKLLGLLNFNAIARRLILDFSDVFASGLEFDRMQYSGLLSDGEALFRDAYIFTPAVFVRMDGKIDLSKELIDMEVHISPELGGNLTLLSALANPTAGAVMFLTQRIFKDEMRESSFRSYRAFGSWEDFELVEMDSPDRDRLLANQTDEPGPASLTTEQSELPNESQQGDAPHSTDQAISPDTERNDSKPADKPEPEQAPE